MNKTVICPGSFDPVTYGHLDVIKRAAKMFDHVIVAVLVNSTKSPCFSIDERMDFLREVTQDIENVEVASFEGLLAEYCRERNVDAIVKGLRAVSDFEYEFQMAITNKKLNPQLETIFLTADADSMYLSSSMVREVASMGGNISNFVPECIHDRIVERINKLRK
ncbi:MAG: pantetheine-phosphate adenylyltransferase [Ruminococcus sp.]|nr:pantetheine-phosphate adenylyltransferase [Ruminococcus sp.]